MLIYLSGPMRHRPYYGFPQFDDLRDRLKNLGYDVVSPADLDRANGFDALLLPEDTDWSVLPDGFDPRHTMFRDIEELSMCDAIYMMDGWRDSKGAKAEYWWAMSVGMPVFFTLMDVPDE